MAAEDEGMDELPPRLAQMFATMDPSTVRSMFPDIADAYTSGAMSHEDAAAAIASLEDRTARGKVVVSLR